MRSVSSWTCIVASGAMMVIGPPTGALGADIRLSPDLPTQFPAKGGQPAAVTFAWLSFIALNWPAAARGVPDRKKVIGQAGRVVWDTWKAPEEIFYRDGRKPPPWNEYGGSVPPECRGAEPDHFMLLRTAKASRDTGIAAFQRIKEAVGGTLTDQHGNLARFDIRMNRAIFETIVKNTYYNRQGQDRASSISFPAGVMEVKAAWRQMTKDDPPAVRARFFRKSAWIYTPGAQVPCVLAEVGLVGLHITQKTRDQPQWTWATFEQVDNVPPAAAGWKGPFSFNNPSCPPAQCPPNRSTEKNGVPTGKPTQVTRVVAIGKAAAQANPTWQARLRAAVPDSPFQYYQLVDIQWPQTPGQRPAGNPVPGLVANTTMETYVRESSCIQCHYTARTASRKLSSDFSFVLGEAK